MINLVPPVGKAKIKREYWARVSTVWLLLWAVSLLVVLAMSIPLYVLFASLDRSLAVQVNNAELVAENFDEAERAVAETRALIQHLDRGEQSNVSFYELVDGLDQISGTEVTLSNFEMERVDGGFNRITLRGEAITRGSLAAFRDRLVSDARFEQVDLPLGSLAEDRNINFSLSVSVVGNSEVSN